MSVAELTRAALALPQEERLVLAQEIWGSLEVVPIMESEQEILLEAIRRDEELESGSVEGIPAEEVYSKIRGEFGWR